MRILMLGGTKFVGRHLVETALSRGHDLTLFHRGQTNRDLFPQVESILGDRDGGLGALDGGTWDCVIDTCGYVPRLVSASASYLAGLAVHYTFISSLSVYTDFGAPNQDETAPVGTMSDPTVEQITAETYGPLKVLCEEAAEREFPGAVLQVRAGVIVGPYDPTDRFTHWVDRVARGGEVLAPDRPDHLVQFIDARDLASWILDRLEVQTAGIFNVTGPNQPLTMGTMLETCRSAAGSDANFVWADDAFLQAEQVKPWSDLPLYLPGPGESFDCGRAKSLGLVTRPLDQTVRDTLAWCSARPSTHEWRAGLRTEREQALLEKWRART